MPAAPAATIMEVMPQPVEIEGFEVDVGEIRVLFTPLADAIIRYAQAQSVKRRGFAQKAIYKALEHYAIQLNKHDILPSNETARTMRFSGLTLNAGTRLRKALDILEAAVPEIANLKLFARFLEELRQRARSRWHLVQYHSLVAGEDPDTWMRIPANDKPIPPGGTAQAISSEQPAVIEPRLVRFLGYLRQMQLNGLIGRFYRAVETSFKKGRTINLFRHYLPFLRQRDERGMADEAAYLLCQAISRLRIRPGAA